MTDSGCLNVPCGRRKVLRRLESNNAMAVLWLCLYSPFALNPRRCIFLLLILASCQFLGPSGQTSKT